MTEIGTETETETTVPSGSVRPGRTVGGAVWRAVVIFVLTIPVIAGGGWVGSVLVRYDSRLVSGPSFVAACVIGVPVVLWLRAGNKYLLATILGAELAAVSLAYLLHNGLVADGRVHLNMSTAAIVYESLAAVGIAVVLVTVVCAAVSGYRHPRQPD